VNGTKLIMRPSLATSLFCRRRRRDNLNGWNR